MNSPIRLYSIFIFTGIIFLLGPSCKKDRVASPAPRPVPVQTVPATPAFINVNWNGVPMNVTAIAYSRTQNSLQMTASSTLQKVVVSSFNIYGSSWLNFQYQWQIDYGTRPDSTKPWTMRTAPNRTSELHYTSGYPVKDSIIKGTFKARFGDKEADSLLIDGTFRLNF